MKIERDIFGLYILNFHPFISDQENDYQKGKH